MKYDESFLNKYKHNFTYPVFNMFEIFLDGLLGQRLLGLSLLSSFKSYNNLLAYSDFMFYHTTYAKRNQLDHFVQLANFF